MAPLTCSAALERAKEAGRKERALLRFREEVVQADVINPELTWAVLYNLALMYQVLLPPPGARSCSLGGCCVVRS